MSVTSGFEEFMYLGASLNGVCGHCGRLVDNYDVDHRVTSVMRGGRGVECVLRGDIARSMAGPLNRLEVAE